MNNALLQLKDIHLPPPLSTWSLAPGWIALLAFLIGLIAAIVYFWYRRNQKYYTVNYALGRLKDIETLMRDNPENINLAGEISILLRRTALHYYHREEIAGLSGRDWLNFLNRSGKTTQFSGENGRLLTEAPYQKEPLTDLAPLFDLTRAWLMTIAKAEK